MKLIVGLGNPGFEYVGTRHNVGFDAVDAIAERLGWVGKGQFDRMARSAFGGLTLDGLVSMHASNTTEKLVLLKPLTYMNLSGQSIAAAVNFFKITPAELIVIVDDMALPVGKIRLRADGSDGGHNGLRSVQQMLGSKAYPRLRIGVGTPPPPIAGRDWVLGKFRPEERPAYEQSIARAAGCVLTWADSGIASAMNQFNADNTAE